MALIDIRQIILEQINPVTNNPFPGDEGIKIVIDCNETINIDPVYIAGAEKVYTNDKQVVAYNFEENLLYGYDLTINFTDFDTRLFSFLTNGIYYGEDLARKNIFGQVIPDGFDSIPGAGFDIYQMSNYRKWVVNLTPPAIRPDPPTWLTVTEVGVPTIADTEYPGSAWNGEDAERRDLVKRKYIKFEDRSDDTITNELLIEERQRLIDAGEEPQLYDYILSRTVSTHTSYVIDNETSQVITDLETGWTHFNLLSMSSVLAIGSGDFVPSSWKPKAVPGVKYNFFCAFETSSFYEQFDGENYSIPRFIKEALANNPSVDYTGEDVLANTYFHLTLDPGARDYFRYLSEEQETNYPLIGTQDFAEAQRRRENFLDRVRNDSNAIVSGYLRSGDGILDNFYDPAETDYLNKTVTIRKQVQFNQESDIVLTCYIVYMPEDEKEIFNLDITAQAYRQRIPFIAPTFFSLTPAKIPIEEETYAVDFYGQNDEAIYYRDMQEQLASGVGAGGMKSPHSTARNYANLFSTTVFAENYKGADRNGYYRLEFPCCHADPPSLNISREFTSPIGVIHARDDYINNRSAININYTGNPEPEPEPTSEPPTIDPIQEGIGWVTGYGIVGATVHIIWPNGDTTESSPSSLGVWVGFPPSRLIGGQIVQAYQIEHGKNPSEIVSTEVIRNT